jgi:hypothetical protein
MPRDWESWLRTATRPASETEEQARDRTEQRIKTAIAASDELPSSVRVYAKGSYANNTNVRGDADVDVAVEWTQEFKVNTWGPTDGMTAAQLGHTPVAQMISPSEFRAQVERALIAAFASAVDTTGDKAIDVAAGTNTLDADVVPCIQMWRYDAPYEYHVGHRLSLAFTVAHESARLRTAVTCSSHVRRPGSSTTRICRASRCGIWVNTGSRTSSGQSVSLSW